MEISQTEMKKIITELNGRTIVFREYDVLGLTKVVNAEADEKGVTITLLPLSSFLPMKDFQIYAAWEILHSTSKLLSASYVGWQIMYPSNLVDRYRTEMMRVRSLQKKLTCFREISRGSID